MVEQKELLLNFRSISAEQKVALVSYLATSTKETCYELMHEVMNAGGKDSISQLKDELLSSIGSRLSPYRPHIIRFWDFAGFINMLNEMLKKTEISLPMYYSEIKNINSMEKKLFMIKLLNGDQLSRLDILKRHYEKGGINYINHIYTTLFSFDYDDKTGLMIADIASISRLRQEYERYPNYKSLRKELTFIKQGQFHSIYFSEKDVATRTANCFQFISQLLNFSAESQQFLLTMQSHVSLNRLLYVINHPDSFTTDHLQLTDKKSIKLENLKTLITKRLAEFEVKFSSKEELETASITSSVPGSERAVSGTEKIVALRSDVEASEKVRSDILESFVDPIDFEELNNPFISPSGHTYDNRMVIALTAVRSIFSDPMTREECQRAELRPNHVVLDLKTRYSNASFDALTLPPELKCPLTNKKFNNPVVAQDGKTYERDALFDYLAASGNKLPGASDPLSDKEITSLKEGKFKNFFVTQILETLAPRLKESKMVKEEMSTLIPHKSTVEDHVYSSPIHLPTDRSLSELEERTRTASLLEEIKPLVQIQLNVQKGLASLLFDKGRISKFFGKPNPRITALIEAIGKPISKLDIYYLLLNQFDIANGEIVGAHFVKPEIYDRKWTTTNSSLPTELENFKTVLSVGINAIREMSRAPVESVRPSKT